MAHKGTVKIELKTRKVFRKKVYEAGTLVDAMIRMDGWAKIEGSPNLLAGPDEYDLFIPDQEYDKLLN